MATTITAQLDSVEHQSTLVFQVRSMIRLIQATTHIGLVWAQMELLFLVLHTTTIIITTTTITVASLCLQTLTIQIARAVGHVMLVSSKSTICVFGGISFRNPLKSSQKWELFICFLVILFILRGSLGI